MRKTGETTVKSLLVRPLVTAVALAAVAAAALAVWAVPAAAGGWAVTTLDEAPGELRVGETHRLGYTIRQHGVSPVDIAGTALIARRGGQTLRFGGTPQGTTGHHVAEVTLPAGGRWELEIVQGPFGTQSLGSVVATSATAPAATTGREPPAAALAVARVALPLAALVAVGIAVVQLRALLAARHRGNAAVRVGA